LRNLVKAIEAGSSYFDKRLLMALLYFNKAFRSYGSGCHIKAIRYGLQAVRYKPNYLTNRGLLVIIKNSIVYSVANKIGKSCIL
jgi:hypothetical protein